MYCPRIGSRRHRNADLATRTKLSYPRHASTSGICSVCVRDGICEIGKKSREGHALFPEPFGAGQFGAEKRLTCLDDVQIIPELFGEEIVFHDVKTECTLGGLRTSIPVTVGAMGSTKVAHDLGEPLARGAAKAGVIMAIGENMPVTYGKEGLEKRIAPYLANYHKYGGIVVQGNPTDQKLGVFGMAKELGAHAVEVKLGQGAKQGLGGEIKFTGADLAKKYEKAGYRIAKNPDGTYQRHTLPGALKEDGLRKMLIKSAEYSLPVWAKAAVGRGILKLIALLEKIKKEQGIPFKCLTIDGHGGGTGMSPWMIMNETCLPSASVFGELRKNVSFDILLAGGLADGADVAKAMMLGANGVSLGRAFLIAATMDKTNGMGVAKFAEALKEEIQMICATQRIDSAEKLIGRKENLCPLTPEAAELFGIGKKSCF